MNDSKSTGRTANFAMGMMRQLIGHATKICDCGRGECHIKQAFFADIPLQVRGGFAAPKDLTTGRAYDVLDVSPGEGVEILFTVADDDGVKFMGGLTIVEEGDIEATTPFVMSPDYVENIRGLLEAHFEKKVANLPPEVAATVAEVASYQNTPKHSETGAGPIAPDVEDPLASAYKRFTGQSVAFGIGQAIRQNPIYVNSYDGIYGKCIVEATNQNFRDPSTGEPKDLVVLYQEHDGEFTYARVNSKRFELAPKDQQINLKEGV